MKIFKIALPCLALSLIFSCQFSNQGDEQEELSADTAVIPVQEISVEDQMKMKDLINSIGPPLEFSYIISDMDIKFSPEVLSDYNSVESYEGSLDQALAMGVYGSDLVYCLVYNRNDLSVNYLEAVKKLTEKLNLSDVLDFEKLEKLSNDEVDANEMALEFTSQMEKVHAKLNDNNQLDLSAMIAFGGWIESMHIASVTGKELGSFSEEMIDIIYYETTLSQTFLDIFQKFDYLPGYETTFEDLEELMVIYENFEVVIQNIDPEVTYTEDMTQVVSLSTQDLQYTKEQTDALMNQIEKIRTVTIK